MTRINESPLFCTYKEKTEPIFRDDFILTVIGHLASVTIRGKEVTISLQNRMKISLPRKFCNIIEIGYTQKITDLLKVKHITTYTTESFSYITIIKL